MKKNIDLVIKLVDEKTDLSRIVNIGWDAWYGTQPLDVYRIPECCHSIGGRWGHNDYWCCHRGEIPSYENLMEFMGVPCQWSFSLTENNYYKYKWEEKMIERDYSIRILRNDKVFYTFKAFNMDWALSKVRMLLFEINEHSIPFHMIDFQKEIINRKILWRELPCIIKKYDMNQNLLIEPDLTNTNVTIEIFRRIAKISSDDDDNFVMEDLFSHSIGWFR